MKDFMSWFIMVAIVILIVIICVGILRSDLGKDESNGEKRGKKHLPNKVTKETGGTDEPTFMIEEWCIAQLDPKSGRPIQKMDIDVTKDDVFTIGRSSECDFALRGIDNKQGTSRFHLGVSVDDKGFFAKPLVRDNGSLALTYIDEKLVMDSFSLVDSQIIWLGNTPITFFRKIRRNKNLKFDPGTFRPDMSRFAHDYNETMAFTGNNRRSSKKKIRR